MLQITITLTGTMSLVNNIDTVFNKHIIKQLNGNK